MRVSEANVLFFLFFVCAYTYTKCVCVCVPGNIVRQTTHCAAASVRRYITKAAAAATPTPAPTSSSILPICSGIAELGRERGRG